MPAAVIGVIVSSAAAATTIGATVLFGAVTVAQVLGVAASLVVGSAMARREEKKATARARAQAIANLRDVQTVVRSAIAPRNIVYGRALVGGSIPSWFTTGDVGQYHHWSQVLAGHEIDGVDEYWIGDEPVTVDGSGFVTTPKYCNSAGQPLIRIRLFKGDQTTLDSEFLSASGGALTVNDCGRGVAWMYVRFEADYDVFGQTGVPTIRAVVRGKPLYDPRTDTTAFTDNTALAVRDYLLANYGLRCQPAEVPDADFIAAANICDEAVPLATGSQARYTVNGSLLTSTNRKENLEALVDAMAGMATWSQGQWRVRAGGFEVPTSTITGADIIAVEDLVAFTPRREIFNSVTGTFIDPASLYAEKQYPVVANAGYVALDGDQVIERNIDLPLCNDPIRAQRMAKVEMERSRQAVTLTVLCKWTVYDQVCGDHVYVTIPRYGWTNKVFFVASRTLSEDGIRLVLRETAAAVWAWNYGEATVVDPAPNTDLPNPYLVPAVDSLAAESGTAALQIAGDGTVISRIRVSWTVVASQYVQIGGRVEIHYRPEGATDWVTARADGDASATFVGPVEDGIVYELRARAVNNIGQRGAWSEITHTVVGKTEPPPDVVGFTINGDRLAWRPVSDTPDLAGYLVRVQYGQNTWWPTAAPLHDGLLTDTPWQMLNRPVGPVTLLIKAVDTSGNESANAAAIVTDLGEALVSNVLLDWPQAPDFDGDIVGGTVVSGVLEADETDSFYGPDNAPFYGGASDPFYLATTWADISYGFSVTPTDAGTLVLEHDISGASYTLEYRRGNQGAFYGEPADDFYGASGDPRYGLPMDWATWPGALTLVASELIEFRVLVAGGSQQGAITVLTAVLDVPDILESLDDVVIGPGGTRLPITRDYRAIKNVQLTLQADGNGGVSVLVDDKNAQIGPLVRVLNAAGTSVAGLLDADIQGF